MSSAENVFDQRHVRPKKIRTEFGWKKLKPEKNSNRKEFRVKKNPELDLEPDRLRYYSTRIFWSSRIWKAIGCPDTIWSEYSGRIESGGQLGAQILFVQNVLAE